MCRHVLLDLLDVQLIDLKLRTLRSQGNLTLVRITALAGFSISLLSKLETDRIIPIFNALEKIYRVYGLDSQLCSLFAGLTDYSLAITSNPTAESRQVYKFIDPLRGQAASR